MKAPNANQRQLQPDGFIVIAHRGASAYAPENTIAAFDLALSMGVKHIELDVQATRDGQLVVIHDNRLDRTTDGSGAVAEYTFAELRALDAGSWFGAKFKGERIPSFEEVLVRYKERLHIHAELKSPDPSLPAQVAAAVRRHGMVEQVTITSFHKAALKEMRACAPELETAWLVYIANTAVIDAARALGCTQICPRAIMLTPERVRRLHDAGFIVRAWGVTSEALMRKVVETGADGMTVDFPDRLIAFLHSQSQQFA